MLSFLGLGYLGLDYAGIEVNALLASGPPGYNMLDRRATSRNNFYRDHRPYPLYSEKCCCEEECPCYEDDYEGN